MNKQYANLPQAATQAISAPQVSNNAMHHDSHPLATQKSITMVHCTKMGCNWMKPYEAGQVSMSTGSGFVIDHLGEQLVATNYHVIAECSAPKVSFPFTGAKKYPCDIVACSPDRDFALLRPRNVGFKMESLQLGNSDTMQVQSQVHAVGFPLGMNCVKTTSGSFNGPQALHGTTYLQVDCAINPGNSGGALVTSQNGNNVVIGLNNCIIQGQNNVGFAQPVNMLKQFMADFGTLKSNSQKTTVVCKPILGVGYERSNESTTRYLKNTSLARQFNNSGAYVNYVMPKSVASKAIREGDQIVEINGTRVDNLGQMQVSWNQAPVQLEHVLDRVKIGERVNCKVFRNGQIVDTSFVNTTHDPRAVKPIYHPYQAPQYKLCGGMLLQQLNMNLVGLMMQANPMLTKYMDPDQLDKPCVVVTHVFPGSETFNQQLVRPSVTLNSIDGEQVQTLQDVENILKTAGNDVQFRFSGHTSLIMDKDTLKQDHDLAVQTYKFPQDKVMDFNTRAVSKPMPIGCGCGRLQMKKHRKKHGKRHSKCYKHNGHNMSHSMMHNRVRGHSMAHCSRRFELEVAAAQLPKEVMHQFE